MLRQVAVSLLVLAVVAIGVPLVSAVGAQSQDSKIEGVIQGADQKPLSGVCVQLRNVDSGQVVSSGKSDDAGKYAFEGVKAGNYIVEALDADCKNVVATSSNVTAAAAGGTISDVVLTVGAPILEGTGFFNSTAGVLLLAGIGATGVGAAVAASNEASPTK